MNDLNESLGITGRGAARRNREGMTWAEWSSAAGGISGPVARASWMRGEDPYDWRVTDDQIDVLAVEAGAAGDMVMVRSCERAASGSTSARAIVADAIRSARGAV